MYYEHINVKMFVNIIKHIFIKVYICSTGNYRPDGKCGPLFGGAECDPNSEYWCCSEHGFCGGTQVLVVLVMMILVKVVRMLLATFGGAECDPNSEYWCCSEHGFCGGTQVLVVLVMILLVKVVMMIL